jgi:hypothetical protein
VLEEEARKGDSDRAEESTWRPAHSDWTMQHELLAQVRDLLMKAHFTNPVMFPRPQSAIEAMRAEIEEQRLASGYARVLDEVEAAQQRWRAMSEEERRAVGVV